MAFIIVQLRAPIMMFVRAYFSFSLTPYARIIRVTLATVVVRPIAMAQEWDNAVMHPVLRVLDRWIAHVFHATRAIIYSPHLRRQLASLLVLQ